LNDLREATFGLIDNYELMTGYNKALTLGAAENTKQFGELARTAIALGRAMGIDAGFALESLNTGIARQSRLFLDNIGIVMSVADANKRYADALGISASALTDNQKREAFRSEALRQAAVAVERLGGVELNAADSLKQLTNQLTNFLNAIASMAAKSEFLSNIFGSIANFITDLITVLQGSSGQIMDAFHALGVMAITSFAGGLASIELPWFLGGRLFPSEWETRIRENYEAAALLYAKTLEKVKADIIDAGFVGYGAGRVGRGGGLGGGVGGGFGGPTPRYPGLGAAGVTALTPIRGIPQVILSAFEMANAKRSLEAFKDSLDAQADAAEFARQKNEHMAMATIQAFSAMAQGSQGFLSSVIGGVASVAAAAVSLTSPVGAAGILAGGSALQRLFNRGPTPVTIEDYSQTAISKLEDRVQPIHMTNIVKLGEVELAYVERELLRRTRRDATFRIVAGSLTE
jgi:hypothetical protein